MISNGELSDPLYDSVNRCLTLVRLRITLLSVELLYIIGELGGIFLRHILAAGM